MPGAFTTVQFEPVYDVYKMRALVDDLERKFREQNLEFESFSGIHNNLTGRSAPDAHPISAITGLTAALAVITAAIAAINVTLADHEARLLVLEAQDESDSFLEWAM
jgi:hypothetical protein